MEDAKAVKPQIEAVFCGRKVTTLLSYKRLEFKINIICRRMTSHITEPLLRNCTNYCVKF